LATVGYGWLRLAVWFGGEQDHAQKIAETIQAKRFGLERCGSLLVVGCKKQPTTEEENCFFLPLRFFPGPVGYQ